MIKIRFAIEKFFDNIFNLSYCFLEWLFKIIRRILWFVKS